jgi:nucleotide-binding universal stress UspA family protein
MSGQIVVGYDGSDCGDDALALGALVARAVGEPLLVVTIYPEEAPIGVGRVDAEWVAFMRDQAREINASARRFLEGRGVSAEYRVVGAGSASQGLDAVAEAEGAAMIVVGSNRHCARRRISPGSTGERLLHGGGCPIAVAPRGMRERPVERTVQRIGVAYIDTPEAREALRVASDLARRTSAALRLYTVVAPRAEAVPLVIGGDTVEAYTATLRESARRALDAALASAPEGVEASGELLEGDVVDELAALDERDVDLLVCGSRGYGPVRRVLLGGVSGRLIRHAACPLVVVPRSAGASATGADRATGVTTPV